MSDRNPSQTSAEPPANLPEPRDLHVPHRVLTEGVVPAPKPADDEG